MASKSSTHRLKVFQAQIGFYDTVVAAPSKAAALRAWGVRQDLFASGDAQTTQDAGAIAAAMKHPERPLRRAVGSDASFELEPTSLPKVPDGPKKQFSKSPPKVKATARSVADRTQLDAAEAASLALSQNRKHEEANFKREEEALETRRTAAQDLYVQKQKKAIADLNAARQQYRKEGGID